MKLLILFLLLVGIVLVTIGYSDLKPKCPPPRIQYRILPQSYINEQLSGQTNSELINELFNTTDPFFREESERSDIMSNSENFYSTF